jgi:pilus assembly protein CpaC
VNGGATQPDAIFVPENARHPALSGDAPWGPAIKEFKPNDPAIINQGLVYGFLNGDFLFNLALDAAKQHGAAKILAEPTLTTLTGQEAQFLSGGEFPIPVPQGGAVSGSVTIEFKEFGVSLRFLPVVLSNNQINLKLNISVSELSAANSIGLQSNGVTSTFVIPSLAKRAASATVEVADGETIGIAGLISESTRSSITKFPGLGDVPVLGALFRSEDFQKGQTELLIIVTPRLAKPLPKTRVPLPTDGFTDPTDAEFYLMGRVQGSAASAPTASPSQR